MKTKFAIVAAVLLTAFGARAALFNLASGTLNTAIPDGNVNGVQSTLTFSDAYFDNVLDVNVKLNISGGYNGDLYVYLTHSTTAAASPSSSTARGARWPIPSATTTRAST